MFAVELGIVVLVYGALAYGTAPMQDRSKNGSPPTSPPWSTAATVSFFAGVAVVACAMVSPLHGWSERSLTWHMVQHVLLVSFAAPLLAAGRPFDLVVSRLGRRSARRSSGVTALVVAAVVQVVVLLAWHMPVVFDTAVRHPVLHEAEHATMLLTAFVLWDTLLRLDALHRGGAVIALFIATLPAMAYGVALTLATSPWYTAYRAGDALGRQQLAGVVMWAYGGLAAVIGGVTLGVDWLRSLERSSPSMGTAQRSAS